MGGHLYFTNGTSAPQIIYANIPFAVAELAVDSQGNAWVFTGPPSWFVVPAFADTLRCIDSTGQVVAAYPCETPFVTGGHYGMVLIGDTFWVGQALNHTITPFFITNGIVYQGTSLPTPSYDCWDLASCNPCAPDGNYYFPHASSHSGLAQICPDSCISFTQSSINAATVE